MLGTDGQQHRIMPCLQRRERHGFTHADAVMKGHALRLHLLDAAVDMVLLHLEVGDAIAQQAAGPRLALEDMNIMAGAGKLLGCG